MQTSLVKSTLLIALFAASGSFVWSWTDTATNTYSSDKTSLVLCSERPVSLQGTDRSPQGITGAAVNPLCSSVEHPQVQLKVQSELAASQQRFELPVPKRSFSFHYLDILEWLFTHNPDPKSNTSQF